MKQFETREAARIVDLPEDRIRSCVRAGFLHPRRGPGRTLWFSFQDLLVLKTTKGLLDSGVPARRITRLLGSLRRQLAAELPLSSLRIYADGTRVVVSDGEARWEPDSGQFLLDLGSPDEGRGRRGSAVPESAPQPRPPAEARVVIDVAEIVARAETPTPGRTPAVRLATPPMRVTPLRAPVDDPTQHLTAEQWFELACELEGESREEARTAYHRALALDPALVEAHINLGRQYHETQEYAEAEAHYRAATEHAPDDPVAWFNLGVLLEDVRRAHEALQAYRHAIGGDPDYADAHYNLGLTLDGLGRRSEAMTHLMKARQLYDRTGERG